MRGRKQPRIPRRMRPWRVYRASSARRDGAHAGWSRRGIHPVRWVYPVAPLLNDSINIYPLLMQHHYLLVLRDSLQDFEVDGITGKTSGGDDESNEITALKSLLRVVIIRAAPGRHVLVVPSGDAVCIQARGEAERNIPRSGLIVREEDVALVRIRNVVLCSESSKGGLARMR